MEPFDTFQFSDYHTISMIYLVGLLLSVVLGNLVLMAFSIERGTNSYLVYSPLLAGVLEPPFSKLVPAMGVSLWVRTKRESLNAPIASAPFVTGVYGGATIGIVEAIGKVVWPYGMYAAVGGFTTSVLLAAGSHAIYGGIIGNAVYRDERTHARHSPVVATLCVILIHFSWNAWHVLDILNAM